MKFKILTENFEEWEEYINHLTKKKKYNDFIIYLVNILVTLRAKYKKGESLRQCSSN